jgi:hypothetical protein
MRHANQLRMESIALPKAERKLIGRQTRPAGIKDPGHRHEAWPYCGMAAPALPALPNAAHTPGITKRSKISAIRSGG